jgi:hypothetical protein
MPTKTYKYYCNTESKYIREIVDIDAVKPNACINDGGHLVDFTTLTIDRRDTGIIPELTTLSATDLVSINSTAYVLIQSATEDDMTLTPGAGKYFVNFSAVYFAEVTNINVQVALFVNGVKQIDSERSLIVSASLSIAASRKVVNTQANITILDGHAIEINVTSNNIINPVKFLERSMVVIKLS